MRRSAAWGPVAMALLAASSAAFGQKVTVLTLPFQTASTADAAIGKKVGVILDLQVWQTLRIPPTGPGRNTEGGILWDIVSSPPTTYAEANAVAKQAQPEDPQLVLWGRTWRYGNGNVVEAFLSIRGDTERNRVGSRIWQAAFPDGVTLSVDIPRWQVDFAPLVLRADLMPELSDPAGLKLFAGPSGPETKGYVGDYFRALEQDPDTARVLLPNGTTGWVRLPQLSREPSEVVNYCGALVRLFRQDWEGAIPLLKRVLDNPRTPTNVRVDAFLYRAIAADKIGADPYPWVRQAYDLNPYSRTTIMYLCLSHVAALARMTPIERGGAAGTERRRLLSEIIARNASLFRPQDPWLVSLRNALSDPR